MPPDPYSPPSVPPQPAPGKVVLAESLEQAGGGTLVMVDAHGRVRGRRSRWLRWGLAIGGGIALGLWLGESTKESAGLASVGALLVALVFFLVALAWLLRTTRAANRAVALVAAGRLDEADELVEQLLQSKPSRYHGVALGIRAGIAFRRGEHAAAADFARRAHGEMRPRSFRPQRYLARYVEIEALACIGRVDEATARLGTVEPEARQGLFEYLLWEAELLIAFCRGTTAVPVEELLRRAEKARPIKAFPTLLVLLAWALQSAGRADQARDFVALARALPEQVQLERAIPALWAWLAAQR